MSTQNDLTGDENLLEEQSGPSGSDLAREFTRPAFTFKGHELRPYTAGTDLLFNQVLDRNDANLTVFLSFIFIHLARHGSQASRLTQTDSRDGCLPNANGRAALLEICWDKTKFRGALLDWIDTLGELTDADKLAAGDLFTQMREGARKSTVEVVPDVSQKKTRAKSRAK